MELALDFSAGIEFFFGQLSKLLFSLGSHFSLTSLGVALVFSAGFFASNAAAGCAGARLCARCSPNA